MQKINVYQEVTDTIISALESNVAPWIKPWKTTNNGVLRNATTNRPYRGINTLLLTVSSITSGYADPRWLTYKNAQSLGGTVSKGQKGTKIIFWNFIETDDPNNPSTKQTIPYARAYTVFNVEQCENVKVESISTHVIPDSEINDLAQSIVTIADIKHAGNNAGYTPSTDTIILPPFDSFNTTNDYYSTAFHEIAHWSGSDKRLKRDLKHRFGSDAYAFEELVAEISCAFLCAFVGIQIEGVQCVEYIDSWLKRFKTDNRAIFTAVSKAQQATDFILEKAGLVDITVKDEANGRS